MRHVVVRPGAGADHGIDRRRLEAVRYLGARFPDARLREVAVVRASELDASADPSGQTRVWLALEALQVTGSFKVRGALSALHANASRGRFVAPSAGNHGVAIAYAGNVLDLQVTVCVPRTAARAKRDTIRGYGAKLVVAGSDHYDDAEILAKQLARTTGAAFVSPYDDEDVVLGNGSSLGFEIVRALGGVPEQVLAPFGGGSLATGLAWAMRTERRGPRDGQVWGVLSEGSVARAESLERGAAVARAHPSAPALADGLEGGIRAFTRAQAAVAGIIVVDDDQIAAAMRYAHRSMGLIVEGAAAAALVPVLFGVPEPMRRGDLVVLLAGRGVDSAPLDGRPNR